MGQINPDIPIIGNPVSTEDPKVKTALETLVATINTLDNANIATAANINAAKLLDASIQPAKLATDSVETAKIKDANVTTAKIDDGAVTTAKINDAAVTTAKINAGAVTTAKVEDGAITSTKMAASSSSNATYLNGAGNGGRPLTARVYPTGQVVLTGVIAKASFASGTAYATIGVAPAETSYFAVSISPLASSPITIAIEDNGVITPFGPGAASQIYLDGVTFHAA
jgi:hypothetical protein